MRAILLTSLIVILSLLSACGNSSATAEKPLTADNTDEKKTNETSSSSSDKSKNGMVGEWEQQYTCFDKNDNSKLEAEEKTPSNTRLGFDWFKFNEDGSCLRDKNVKFKGTYEIQEKNGNRKLVIQGGGNLRYTIAELTGKELILGSDGAFIVFKRIQ